MRAGDPTIDRTSDDLNDQAIMIWTKLQVTKDQELDTEWAGYFQPLIRAPGHERSGWARVQGCPETILLVTAWARMSDMREFIGSPSAQLYRENLDSRGIIYVSSRETFYDRNDSSWFGSLLESYVQLLWIYFPTPVTEAHKAQISQLIGMREHVIGMDGRPFRGIVRRQNSLTLKIWAAQTEFMHGQETQSMLWLHFWVNAKQAEYRNAGFGHGSLMETFSETLEEVGPLEWKKQFCDFKATTYV